MQSFFTILIAAFAAFTAIFLLNPEPAPETANYISVEIPDLALSDAGLPGFLLTVQEPLVLARDFTDGFELGADFAADGIAVLRD
jgi:hypothetical protein